MFPGFEGMIPTSATGPQECLLIMALDFRSLIFEGMARIPTYSSWLLQCDMEPAYRYHRRVLQLLQWRCPPERWWLKTPAHMLSIDALDAVYPDARFVMTHRDVGKVLPSVCALYDTFSSILTDRPDPLAIGTLNADQWCRALERVIAFRDAGNEDRFHDLLFEAVQHEPMAQVAELTPPWATTSTTPTAGCRHGGPRARRTDLTRTSFTAGPTGSTCRPSATGSLFYTDRFDVPVEHETMGGPA
jgi:hypothetical protein